MTILLLSVGTRNKIIQYFKRLDGVRVVVTDMLPTAPAIYEADKHYLVPRITDVNYLDIIIDICKREKVDGVLSLIDPELELLAKNRARFDQIGVTVIGSDAELCAMAFDKMKLFRWMKEHGYRCAKSYVDLDEFLADLSAGAIRFPVYVKPVCGSASLGIVVVNDTAMLRYLFETHEDLMIQEYLTGKEIGADVYIDMLSKEVVSIFTKEKLLMRAGETDKSVSFKDYRLFELIERFCRDCGWLGQIDIDLFEIDGEYYISEVNPRFGGGYPHAYECGCNHMQMIANNLMGVANEKAIGAYEQGVYMMKYGEVAIRKGLEDRVN